VFVHVCSRVRAALHRRSLARWRGRRGRRGWREGARESAAERENAAAPAARRAVLAADGGDPDKGRGLAARGEEGGGENRVTTFEREDLTFGRNLLATRRRVWRFFFHVQSSTFEPTLRLKI